MSIHQFKRKPFRVTTEGQYYGWKLSHIERATIWYERNWKLAFFWTGVVAVCAGAAYAVVSL